MKSEPAKEIAEVALVHLLDGIALLVSVLDAFSAGFLTALAELACASCRMQNIRFPSPWPLHFVLCLVAKGDITKRVGGNLGFRKFFKSCKVVRSICFLVIYLREQ